jgi:4'-phosphopantetheinyl transferase
LETDEIHIWRAFLDMEGQEVKSLLKILSGNELARAERFYSQRKYKYFIVARAVLRIILGYYLNIEPRKLRFCYSQNGKPALASDLNIDKLNFNLSHSNRLVLYAITRGREIGIDMEHVQDSLAFKDITNKFLSPREISEFNTLPTTMQKEAFFRYWVCKEACLKAMGERLLTTLKQFDISIAPGKSAALLSINGDSQQAPFWSLQELVAGPGFVSAFAVKGHNLRIKCYQWPEPCRGN